MVMKKLITIPIKPISVNKVWQGRRFKTAEYKKWREEAMWLLSKQKPIKECTLILDFYVKNATMTDVDNLIKPTLDALVEKGLLVDDRYITSLTATKHKGKEERIVIQIIPETL